jgi:co-chaperonin GroES (HSP10)
MAQVKIREGMDDYNIDHAANPTMPMRTMSEYETFADTGFKLEELPEPNLWRCLIFPKQAKKQTESGIVLAKESTDAEEALQYIGQVIKIGPLAGRNKQYENPDYKETKMITQPERWLWNIKPMDWVLFGKFAGLQIDYKGQVLKLLNDDDIIAKIDSPDNYKVYN